MIYSITQQGRDELQMDDTDKNNLLLMLSAALFAVRLFKAPEKVLGLEAEARVREDAARRSTLDAAAIMAKVEKII